jgi:hypothetical protein
MDPFSSEHPAAEGFLSNRPGASAPFSVASLEAPIRPFDYEEEIERALGVVEHHTMVTRLRLSSTYQLTAAIESAGIAGALVECGTWKGGAAGMMTLASLAHRRGPRHLHLFDSFDDMVMPDEEVDGDLAVAQARATPGVAGPLTGELKAMPGFYDLLGGHGTAEEVRSLLLGTIGYPPDELHLHEGWFQHTVLAARAEIGPIAVLRLDTDFYAGTRCCLEALFDQVVDGGVVMFDDYGCYEGCRRAVDEFLATVELPHLLNHVDAEGRYLIKRSARRVTGG